MSENSTTYSYYSIEISEVVDKSVVYKSVSGILEKIIQFQVIIITGDQGIIFKIKKWLNQLKPKTNEKI